MKPRQLGQAFACVLICLAVTGASCKVKGGTSGTPIREGQPITVARGEQAELVVPNATTANAVRAFDCPTGVSCSISRLSGRVLLRVSAAADAPLGTSTIRISVREAGGCAIPFGCFDGNLIARSAHTLTVVDSRPGVAASGYEMASSPVSLKLADMNADGVLDLVTGNELESASIRVGLADGTFGSESGIGVGAPVSDLVAGDLNHDSIVDLVVLTADPTPRVLVLFGRGELQFDPPRAVVMDDKTPGLSDATRLLALAGGELLWEDVDGDGNRDLIAGAQYADTSGAAAVFLARDDGSFAPAVLFASEMGGPAVLASGDMDADGFVDLVMASRASADQISILWNDGAGTFEAERVNSMPAARIDALAVTDVDGDGWNDVVLAGEPAGVLFTRHPAGFAFRRIDRVASATAAVGMEPGNSGGQRFALVEAARVCVLEHQVDGSFRLNAVHTAATPVGAIVAGNLGADGVQDLVVTRPGVNRVDVLGNLR